MNGVDELELETQLSAQWFERLKALRAGRNTEDSQEPQLQIAEPKLPSYRTQEEEKQQLLLNVLSSMHYLNRNLKNSIWSRKFKIIGLTKLGN